jgi:hypothetical protein
MNTMSPTAQQLLAADRLPLHRRLAIATSCAIRVLRTGRTWQHEAVGAYVKGHRDGMESGLEIAAQSLAERNMITAPVVEKLTPHLTLVSGGAR